MSSRDRRMRRRRRSRKDAGRDQRPAEGWPRLRLSGDGSPPFSRTLPTGSARTPLDRLLPPPLPLLLSLPPPTFASVAFFLSAMVWLLIAERKPGVRVACSLEQAILGRGG